MSFNFSPYIRLAMYHTWLSDYYLDRSIFDFELIFIDKGKMKIEIDGNTLIVSEGDFILIPPNVHHKISWYEENCCQPHVHFDFVKDALSETVPISFKTRENMSDVELTYFRENFLKKNNINVPYVVHPKNISFVRDTMLDLIDAFTFLDPMKELRMEGDLKTLISIFISESLEYNLDSENMDTITLLVRYRTENLKENLTLNDFELKTNLTSWTLNNLFRKVYNTTPKKYYDGLRIVYVKNLLRNSFKSIKEISEMMHFNEPQTFSRWFYNLDGRYPTEYKKAKSKKVMK